MSSSFFAAAAAAVWGGTSAETSTTDTTSAHINPKHATKEEVERRIDALAAALASTDTAALLRKGGEPGLLPSAPGTIDRATLSRWLKAEKLDVASAAARLEKHAHWRADYVPTGRIEPTEVAEELANDKVFIQPGADASGRPVVIITVRKHHKNHNAAALARLKRFICWVFDVCVAKATGMSVTEDGSGGEAAGEVEVGGGAVGEEEEEGEAEGAGAPSSSPPRARRPAAPLGDGKLTAIFDLRGASMENMDVAGLKQIFGLLQSHFPERLGRMVFLDPPVIFWGVWRVVSPFVDPVTRAKVVMASLRDLSEGDIVPLRILPEDMGGEAQARSVVEAASELGLLPRGVDVAALAAEAGERRARSASGSPEKASSAGAAAGEGRAAAVAGASAASAAASADDEEDEEGFEDAVDDDEDQPDDEEVAALEEAMQRELRMGSANGDENALPGAGGAGAAAAPKVGAVFVAAAAAFVRE